MHEEDSYLSMPQERDERWWRRVGSMFEHRAGSMFGQDSPIASSEAPAASHLPSQAGSGSRLTDVGDSGEALFDACTRGDLGDAERLLCDRADPCHRGEFGATPLLRAAEQGHVGLVSLLLSHGGRHDIQDDNNDTALLCACRMGHAGVARVLLSAGADPGVTNNQGNNSLDVALEARNLLARPEVSELLLGHRRGDNPLEAAPRVAAAAPFREDAPLAATAAAAAFGGPAVAGAGGIVPPPGAAEAPRRASFFLKTSTPG